MTNLAILELFFYFLLPVSVLVLILKMLSSKRKSNKLNDIELTQAKLSFLRMSIKSKIRKKVNTLKSQFGNFLTEGDPIDAALDELMLIQFQI